MRRHATANRAEARARQTTAIKAKGQSPPQAGKSVDGRKQSTALAEQIVGSVTWLVNYRIWSGVHGFARPVLGSVVWSGLWASPSFTSRQLGQAWNRRSISMRPFPECELSERSSIQGHTRVAEIVL
jgi:hypothetical protein